MHLYLSDFCAGLFIKATNAKAEVAFLVAPTPTIMLSAPEYRKKLNKLGLKTQDLTDEAIEQIRDALYLQAGLIFDEWKKSHCLTSADAIPASLEVSQRLTSTPLHAGVPVDAK